MGDIDYTMVNENRRNFRLNPVTRAEMEECRWYAVVDDTIGGYNISNVDKPTSQTNPYEGEFTLGTFITRTIAEHIVDLHNTRWDKVVWDSYWPNIAHSLIKPLTEDEWFDYDDDHETP